jgi:hypothetical protein
MLMGLPHEHHRIKHDTRPLGSPPNLLEHLVASTRTWPEDEEERERERERETRKVRNMSQKFAITSNIKFTGTPRSLQRECKEHEEKFINKFRERRRRRRNMSC